MMKRHWHLMAAAVLGLGLFTTACHKDDDTGPVATSNEVKLAGATWHISAAKFSDTAVTDSSFYTDCMEDDSLNFSLNRQFSFSDGSAACDSSLVAYGSGTWAFNAAEDTLSLKYSDVTLQCEVIKLTDSTFQISYADSIGHRKGTKTLEFAAKQ